MRPLRAWFARFASMVALGRREREFDAELESHLQLHIDDGVRAGLTCQEARRQALIRLGGREATRQIHGDRRGLRWIEQVFQDTRYGLRAMRMGTSWMAVVMLAIAIGLSTAMFAIVDALLLRPVPFPNADRLAQINLRGEHDSRPPIWDVVHAWQRGGMFDAVESQLADTALVNGDAGPVAVTSARVTPGMLPILGVGPSRGRTFAATDRSGVVISESLWRRAFDADPAIIGRTVTIDRDVEIVIGVMPAAFRFPSWNTEAWRLFTPTMLREARPASYALLSQTVPLDHALRQATAVAREAWEQAKDRTAEALPLAGWRNNAYAERALPLLGGGVTLVFLSLCANASGLLLVRFNARRRQFGLCAALGASRRRLLTQAMAESAIIGAVSAVVGVLLAAQLVAAADALLPRAFLERSLHTLRIDATNLGVAIGLAALATLLAGLLPALVATRMDVSASLRVVERGGTEIRAARVLTRSLIVGEIALACTLLVGAALLVRSFLNLAAIDRGFDSRSLTIVRVAIDNSVTRDQNGRMAAVTRATEAFKSLPGVTGVAWSIGAPTAASGIHFGDWIPDTPGARPVSLVVSGMSVGGDFFELYGIPMLRGRAPATADSDRVTIDERMAAALWPGVDPVGRSFTWNNTKLEVVGVAKSVHRLVIDRRQDYPTLYWPFQPGAGHGGTVSLRCAGVCPTEGVIRRRLLDIGPAVAVTAVKTLEASYEEDLAEPRLTAVVAGIFSAIALLASTAGLFTVLSYAAARRRREFGIRAALGASAGAIGSLVVRDGAGATILGLAIGSIGAWSLARFLESVQFGVTTGDPISWAVVVGALAATTLVAAWRPARAAMRVDPVTLLKEE